MDEHKTTEELLADLEDAKAKIEIGATYQHYKNKQKYKVLLLATQEADNELAVVYQQLYDQELLFTRPLSVWCESVEWDGQKVPRFKRVLS